MRENRDGWDEEDSRLFIDYGKYFVPDREIQIETILDLIPPIEQPFCALELCCGEGLLAGALLERFSNCIVHGFDGSGEMLATAKARLSGYGERFSCEQFDLASYGWRVPRMSIDVVVSSLAIHHLDDRQKQQLFRDVYGLLNAGGIFLIADLIRPADARGLRAAARAWDDSVRQRSLQEDGNLRAFDFFREEKWNLYHYPDDPVDKPSRLFDQLEWLAESGFINADVYWMKAGHAIFGALKHAPSAPAERIS